MRAHTSAPACLSAPGDRDINPHDFNTVISFAGKSPAVREMELSVWLQELHTDNTN
jgi:hypothetical protein